MDKWIKKTLENLKAFEISKKPLKTYPIKTFLASVEIKEIWF
jgi:hypothetical protein